VSAGKKRMEFSPQPSRSSPSVERLADQSAPPFDGALPGLPILDPLDSDHEAQAAARGPGSSVRMTGVFMA